MAAELEIPWRSLANFEAGVNMPAPVMLRFLVATRANPVWLMNGQGDRYLPAGRGERPVIRRADAEC